MLNEKPSKAEFYSQNNLAPVPLIGQLPFSHENLKNVFAQTFRDVRELDKCLLIIFNLFSCT